ncbi:hypothetical protein OE88DRAFT_1660880 [Heliocybe sulcata]|uniref:F-box domain-containing protein n=1 Tax=Heliocybe sulcata TaxID=5364 RepID=A0A5C3MZX9_9AGAM|nr:hypothetical protein OE88DRAFT_1660880 [Heliocybe sulcata]
MNRLRLPVELVLSIVSSYVENLPLHGQPCVKPDWNFVKPVSLVSHACRRAALEAWFRTLRVRNRRDLVAISRDWPELYRWARTFVCISPDHNDLRAWDLFGFVRLRSVVVRMSPGGHECPIRFINVPPSVDSLELNGMVEATPLDMGDVAEAFPNLRTLTLRPQYTWCGLCNTSQRPVLSGEIPSLLVYKGGIGLPVHYAKFLSALTTLETFRITTIYKDNTDEHSVSQPPWSRYLDIGKNEHIWVGECHVCVVLLYRDDGFRESWVAKKREPEVRPPALQTVEWAFMTEAEFFVQYRDLDDILDDEV